MTESNTHLVRTKHGRMVHKRGCSYASWGKPWVWAEGKGHSEIVLSTIGLGVGFCKRCEPLVDLPADREVMPLREGTCATHGEYNNFSGRCLACIPAGDLLKRGDA